MNLTPSEELLLELLAARYRLGEPFWTFEYRYKPTLAKLEAKGLIRTEPAVTPHIEAYLTEAAKADRLMPGYTPPGARVEWAVQTDEDVRPVHYVLRSGRHDARADEEHHRRYAARHDGRLFRRVTVEMPWEQVPVEVRS